MKTEEFLRYLSLKRHYSDLTITSYRSDLLQFENFLTKDSSDTEILQNDDLIGVNAVRSWIMTLTEQGLTARSINRKISTLRAYFRWCEQNDANFRNPMLKIVMPKMSKRKLSALSEDETEELLSNRPNEDDFDAFRNYVIMEILYATGMRQSELLNLQESDISFSNSQIKVLGKGNKQRIIPIQSKLIADIVKYIEIKRRYKIKEGCFAVTKEGKPLTKAQLYYIVHRMLAKYKVSEKSPHVFRHTCATHLVDNGADIMNVKNLLGHASLSATEVYTHTTIEQLKREYKRSFEHNFNS